MYAILSHGGRQYRVSAGDRLVVDRLDAEVGSVIALEPVLLTGGDGTTTLGEGVAGMRVAAVVVGHSRGPKLRIFKFKAKKRYRRAAGYRSDLTEVRIDSILARGEKLPAGAATSAPAAKPTTTAKPAKTAKTAAPAKKAPAAKATPAPAAKASPAKRTSRPKSAATDGDDSKETGDGT